MRLIIPGFVFALALSACGDQLTAADNAGPSTTLALAVGQPNATGVVRGMVMGVRSVSISSDTGSITRLMSEPVSGATVQVVREVRDSAGTSPVNVTSTVIGSVVTGTDGGFTLTSVQSGYYRLDVTPPANSLYRRGTSGTESFSAGSTGNATVYLSLR